MATKLFIVLLAVCLVSTQAFVKRDAPATATATEVNYLDNIQKQIQELTKNVNDKLSDAFKPENIQKGINDAVDNLQKALNDLKEKANVSPPK